MITAQQKAFSGLDAPRRKYSSVMGLEMPKNFRGKRQRTRSLLEGSPT